MKTAVIAFERPVTGNLYTKLAQVIYPQSLILSISNFRGKADIWTGDFLNSKQGVATTFLFDQYAEEIIQRCRFLRSINKSKAYDLAARFWWFVENLFKKYNIIAVFQPMIDEYTLDIMQRVASLHNVPVVSFVGHFFNGYFRITTRGELNILRDEPSSEEVDSVCAEILQDSYKPSFESVTKKSQIQIAKSFFRRKIIENIYYPIKKIIERDPYNYHYNTLILKGRGLACISRKRYQEFSDLEDISKLSRKQTVYLPLHVIPEATTDYWCDSCDFVHYEEGISKLIQYSDKDVIFIIKEHPSMDGWRNPDFYRRLNKFPNVYFISPYVNSNALLNLVDNVVVHTGSVGVEALMRGKRVFCLTSSYYSDLHPAAMKVNTIKSSMLKLKIPKYDNRTFVCEILKGLYPGVWNPKNLQSILSQDALICASRKYLERYYG